MSRHPLVAPLRAPLTALALAACAADAPDRLVSPTAAPAAARAARGVAVPFRGSVEASETGAFDPVIGRVRVSLTASGQATHLGRYTLVSNILVEPVSAVATGQLTITAADGSTLTATFTGLGIRHDGLVAITETATVTGGTGRFLGASGSLVLTRTLTEATGVSTGRLDGELVLPR